MQPTWRKATKSGSNGACVEVARLSEDRIGVRDSKNPNGPVLVFTAAEWDAFLDGMAKHEFDKI